MPPRAPAARGAVGPALLAGLVALLFVQAASGNSLIDGLNTVVDWPDADLRASYCSAWIESEMLPFDDVESDALCADREVYAMNSWYNNDTAAECCFFWPSDGAMFTATNSPPPTSLTGSARRSTTTSCCEEHAGTGCTSPDTACQSDVCATDPFCCFVGWDHLCASRAFKSTSCSTCQAVCGDNKAQFPEQCDVGAVSTPTCYGSSELVAANRCKLKSPTGTSPKPGFNDDCASATPLVQDVWFGADLRNGASGAFASASLNGMSSSSGVTSRSNPDRWFNFSNIGEWVQISTCGSSDISINNPTHNVMFWDGGACPSTSAGKGNLVDRTPNLCGSSNNGCPTGEEGWCYRFLTQANVTHRARVVSTRGTSGPATMSGQKIKASCGLTQAYCPFGFVVDPISCQCVCGKRNVGDAAFCGANHEFVSDATTCGCKCKISAATCPSGTTFDDDACACKTISTQCSTKRLSGESKTLSISNGFVFPDTTLDWIAMDGKIQASMKTGGGQKINFIQFDGESQTPINQPTSSCTFVDVVNIGFFEDSQPDVDAAVDKKEKPNRCDRPGYTSGPSDALALRACGILYSCPPLSQWWSQERICKGNCPGGKELNSASGNCVCPAGKPTWNGTACVESACTPATRRRYADEVTCECVFGELAEGEVNPEPEGGVMTFGTRHASNQQRACRRGMRVRVNKKKDET